MAAARRVLAAPNLSPFYLDVLKRRSFDVIGPFAESEVAANKDNVQNVEAIVGMFNSTISASLIAALPNLRMVCMLLVVASVPGIICSY